MEKNQMKRDLERFCGGVFITRQKLAESMGISNPRHVDRFLAGLERIDGKYYLVSDIAARLKERCTV
ncbi:hypothetical protein AALA22_14265 [Anaerovoracaceae bacterium 41-7]